MVSLKIMHMDEMVSWKIMHKEEMVSWKVMHKDKTKLWCLLFFLKLFWATFGGKIGVATTRAPDGLGLSNPTKKLAHWVEILGQLLSRNCKYMIEQTETLLNTNMIEHYHEYTMIENTNRNMIRFRQVGPVRGIRLLKKSFLLFESHFW